MRRLIFALFLAVVLTMATVVPAFAVVHIVAPICEGFENSGGKAGGTKAGPVVSEGGAGEASGGAPFPAQGEANSGDHSPDALTPGVGCP